MPTLQVYQAKQEDIYKDVIRVFENDRKDCNSTKIPSGMICRVTTSINKRVGICAILRGTTEPGKIFIDEPLRERLGLKEREMYNFSFVKLGHFRSWLWAWNATDPGYRISVRIAVILGITSVVLGIISLI